MTQTAIINIKDNSENVVLQKEQKRFNKLTADITKRRQKLLALNDAINQFKVGYYKDIVPYEDKTNNLLIEVILLADKNFDAKVFTNADRKRIIILIEDLIKGFDEKYINAELKSVFFRRLGVDFDTYKNDEKNDALDFTKDMFKTIFDLNVDIDERLSPEEIASHLAQQFAAHQQSKLSQPQRKKSARTLAKEAREKAIAESTTKSIRDVYRQLAKVLHPDRIANDEDYKSKNALMQEVNAAYAKHDLLTLLAIQLKIEQISQENINDIALDKLKHFNAVLKKQLNELNGELLEVSQHFGNEFPDFQTFAIWESREILSELKSSLIYAKNTYNSLEVDFSLWSKDLKQFRTYLRKFINLNKSQDDLIDPMDILTFMSAFEEMERK